MHLKKVILLGIYTGSENLCENLVIYRCNYEVNVSEKCKFGQLQYQPIWFEILRCRDESNVYFTDKFLLS